MSKIINNPTHIASSGRFYSPTRRATGCWKRFLTASLTLGLAAALQTVRADLVVMDDDFNNASNNIANNDGGIGGGYATFTAISGQVRETNSLVQLASTVNGADRAVIASQNYAAINGDAANNGGGTVFDFQNVSFTNTTTGGTPNTDRLILGVLATNTAGDWFESGLASMPEGFYIEPNSDSIARQIGGTGNSGWADHNSVLFYKNAGTNVTILAQWQFQTLNWSPAPFVTDYSPVLDIQLKLSAAGWAFSITGDLNTNGQPISFSGTYAGSGITNILVDGIHNPYVGGENQTEAPSIRMSIDRILVKHLGDLIVTTPMFSTPNIVFDGALVGLSSYVTDSVATPTLQWQIADLSNPGAFTNLPNATNKSVSVDTTGLGALQPRGIRLLASDTMGNSVTSAVVNVTIKPPGAPQVVQDINPGGIVQIYAGQGVLFSASFAGSPPITYQWQRSQDESSWTDILGATNNTYAIANYAADGSDDGFWRVQAKNPFGSTPSSDDYTFLASGVPQYLWSYPMSIAGLNADQILTNFPGSYIAGALVAKNGGAPILVTNSNGSIISFSGSGAWASLSGGTGYSSGAYTNNTGNTNFNTCLNDKYTDNATHTITMSNLVVGQQYQVQLFALDDRSALTPPGSSRYVNFQDPSNMDDVVQGNFSMADLDYVLGTFIASNSVQTIQQNLLTNSGNFNCMVLRAVGWEPPPYWELQPHNGFGFVGTNTSMTGLAAGDTTIASPTITYQWQDGPAGGPYTNLIDGAKYAGTTSSTLSVSNLDFPDQNVVYILIAKNGAGSVTSSIVNILVESPNLLGEWFNGTNNLADVSGFSPAGTHDGYDLANAGGSYKFTNDVPPGRTGVSLYLNNDGIGIGNSSTLDAGYTNTFDDYINHSMTVAVWAKGWPGGWNPWVSKYGEGPGWQLRNDGNNNVSPCWSIRGTGGTVTMGTAVYGNPEDMAATSLTLGNDGLWHCYVGTYNSFTGIRNLYVDGQLAAQETGNALYNMAQAEHLVIGAKDSPPGNNFGNWFTGEIYDVRIYNYDLNSNQVQTLSALPDPSIRGEPAPTVTVYVGTTAQIAVKGISGTAPLTNHWQFNTTNIADNIQFFGSQSNVLTIYNVTTNNAGIYDLVLSNSVGMTVSSNVTLIVLPTAPAPATNLVAEWFAGMPNLTDVSGYSPAGTHDGYAIGGTNYSFTSDVPPSASGESLNLGGNTAIAISNSATVVDATGGSNTNLNPNYTNTFDVAISNKFSVTFWAKGFPGQWNPWVSKYGETGGAAPGTGGWQLRRYAGNNTTTFTLRGTGAPAGDDQQGSISSNDGQWHFYAGTYDVVTGIRTLYVDGSVSISTTGNGQYTTAPECHLVIMGKDQPPGNNYASISSGKIYDVRIYDTALSAAQVNSFIPAVVRKPIINSSVIAGSGGNPGQLQLTWPFGTLLEATNVAGPWTTNNATPPYTIPMTNPAEFYKMQSP